jgi:hypothetical protein
MTGSRVRRCHACGVGEVRPLAADGRIARYRTLATVPIPRDLPIPTCSNCGAEWLDEETTKALDEALEVAYRAELRARAVQSIERINQHAAQRRVELLLGLSQGYLSKVRSGARAPSPELVSQLALLAGDPAARLRELEDYWSNPPAS